MIAAMDRSAARRLRLAVRLALAALLVAGLAGIATETHRPCFSLYHPGVEHAFGAERAITADFPLLPLILLGLAAAAQLVAPRLRPLLASGLGLAAAGAALTALMSLAWIHARAHTIGDLELAAPALLAAAALGLTTPLIELWLARRRT